MGSRLHITQCPYHGKTCTHGTAVIGHANFHFNSHYLRHNQPWVFITWSENAKFWDHHAWQQHYCLKEGKYNSTLKPKFNSTSRNSAIHSCSPILHLQTLSLSPRVSKTHFGKCFLAVIFQMQGVDIQLVFVDGERVAILGNLRNKFFHLNSNAISLVLLLKGLYGDVRGGDTV